MKVVKYISAKYVKEVIHLNFPYWNILRMFTRDVYIRIIYVTKFPQWSKHYKFIKITFILEFNISAIPVTKVLKREVPYTNIMEEFIKKIQIINVAFVAKLLRMAHNVEAMKIIFILIRLWVVISVKSQWGISIP